MYDYETALANLHLSFEDLHTPDWAIVFHEADRQITKRDGHPMASFDLPVECMEDPWKVYNHQAMRFGKPWMRWMLEHHPIDLGVMMMDGTLGMTVREVESKAVDRWIELQAQMAKQTPELTEELKNTDMMRWVGIMNNIRSQTAEIVLSELTPYEE